MYWVETSKLDKPPNHVKVGFIEGDFVRRASIKQNCLAYRDQETTILTFRTMKLKIDPCNIFIKVFCEKYSTIASFVEHSAHSAVEWTDSIKHLS